MQRHKVIGHRSLRLSQFLLSLNTLPLNVQQIGQRCRPGALPLLSQIESPRAAACAAVNLTTCSRSRPVARKSPHPQTHEARRIDIETVPRRSRPRLHEHALACARSRVHSRRAPGVRGRSGCCSQTGETHRWKRIPPCLTTAPTGRSLCQPLSSTGPHITTGMLQVTSNVSAAATCFRCRVTTS